ncbi:MAG TPA: polysaccharide lyase beta-sandwich domain-containing protein, partial [Prolixibacteraceae bacterium]|nr:polysaccharide lyase beta-sandwich domain-containing protein [Prolixibacteraceae bacterium]
IVVPNVSEQEVAETAGSNREIQVLSNTPDLQAVKSKKLEMCQATFYKAGELKVAEDFIIKLASQGMVMVKMDGTRMKELAVADPSRKLSRMLITVSGLYELSGDGFQSFRDESKKETLIIIDLPQDVYAGKSVTVKM